MAASFVERLLARDVAMDLGTANTQIYVRHRGVILDQPSVVCLRRSGNTLAARVEAVGERAQALLGREPQHLEAIRPLRHGVIADYHIAELMMRQFVAMSRVNSLFARCRELTLCVPSGATALERRAVREAAMGTVASRVRLIDATLAAAFGAGLPVTEAVGSMVIDIGGGTTTVAIVALGGVVYQASVRVGGDDFDEAIVNHVRNLHGILLGLQTAEYVKKEVGAASRCAARQVVQVVGRCVGDGMPREVKLDSDVIADALAVPMNQVVSAVKAALENAPAELITDIAHRGAVLTGGGALLANIPQRLLDETGLRTQVAKHPLTCAIRGAGEGMDRLQMEADA
ncbi:rod shape-determining protein [Burkholderia gladioli]|uniref:rod shape-determining protein n=1 Tax=Burkholderia gladioli TaxID=28095 RepID=UPI003F7AC250